MCRPSQTPNLKILKVGVKTICKYSPLKQEKCFNKFCLLKRFTFNFFSKLSSQIEVFHGLTNNINIINLPLILHFERQFANSN